MTELFFQLPEADRKDGLEFAASQLGTPAHLLEKDVWVVWALDTLFQAPVGKHLVFKGGTSLSKVHRAIRRFSEDIDLTYDIRAIAPHLTGDDENPVPASRSQEKKWTKEIRERLPRWIDETVLPLIKAQLESDGLTAMVRREGDSALIEYTAIANGTGYVRPIVLLEFGARSTGEPAETYEICCDAAPALAGITFPSATPRVMRAERTFWEKATAIHVYCKRGQFRGRDKYARHWYDLACLDNAGIANSALVDHELRDTVATHKSHFFPEKDSDGHPIDYHAATKGAFCLVPKDEAFKMLQDDYQRMIDDGLFFDEPERFEVLMDHCAGLEQRANKKNK